MPPKHSCFRSSAAALSINAIYDALGSVRAVTDSSGAVVARFEYGAWGNALAGSFDNVPNGGMPFTWIGGAGVKFDADCGLFLMRERYYDPQLSRFISRDPRLKSMLAYSQQKF